MNEVFIIAGCRTPIGSFKKGLSTLSAAELGAITIRETLSKVSCKDLKVDEVLMGQVCQANCGQAPARQAALLANLPNEVSCTTINKVCASGMKSIIFGSQSIMCGVNDIVIAGGQESMSNVPFYLPRKEPNYGGCTLIDGLLADGLTDSLNKCHMGTHVERVVEKLGIDRKDQDQYAQLSYKRAQNAVKSGIFDNEIVPITVRQKSGDVVISEDEEYSRANFDRFASLKPAFKSDGTITAANASSLADGAACLLLASKKSIESNDLKPIAKVLGFADAAVEPGNFIIAPLESINKLLEKHCLLIKDISLWEINEAFSVAVLANLKLMPEINIENVNIHGGAVSLGHPLGMSGARIVLHLALNLQPGQKGIASICNGGGGTSSILLEGC